MRISTPIRRRATIAVLSATVAGACLYLAGCSQAPTTPNPASPVGEQTKQATQAVSQSLAGPGATLSVSLPQAVPSSLATPLGTVTMPQLPNPVATAAELATERALAPTVMADRIATATAFAEPVLQADYGSWSFSIFRDPGDAYQIAPRLYGSVRFDDGSVAGLKAYAKANQDLAAQLASQAGQGEQGEQRATEVSITFRNYVSAESFDKWAAGASLHVEYTDLAVEYERDPRLPTPPVNCPDCAEEGPPYALRIQTQPADAEPLSQGRVEEALSLQKKEESAKGYRLSQVRGVYFTRAKIDSGKLPTIARDPQVFLADVTFEAIRRQLRAKGVPNADATVLSSGGAQELLFWQMQTLGLDNFAK